MQIEWATRTQVRDAQGYHNVTASNRKGLF